jgi:WD40 repeat protein
MIVMYNQGKIIKRLLGRPNNDISSDTGLANSNSPNPQTYRPNASQNAEYPSSDPIACVDRTPDGRVAVLGGRHVLKTIHIDGQTIKEGVDVRSAITAQFAKKGSAASQASEQLSIKDVKVATHHGAEPTIFTACANGKIFTYDINRLASGLGLEFMQTWEGSRQINKLDFNPHNGKWMLSGGQDGIVRVYDINAPVMVRNALTLRAFRELHCNADGIRDVKWAPKDGFVFACGTESGAIFKWDIRKHTMPLLKINAHDTQKGVSSISWHPDGDHLISSCLDGKCHVWDLSKKAERRQKAKWTINAPAPITSVSWRPGLWSATAQGRRAAQVAVAYDEGGNLKKKGITSIHIWDLARPTMPYKEIDGFDTSPSALLWHDQDLLWAVGRDGFTQCDVAFAPKVMDRQPLSSLDFSARGEVLLFLEERVQVSRSRATAKAHDLLPTSSLSSSPTGQKLSISHSDSEEDVIGSFLGPKRRVGGKRRGAHRPAQSLSTTPPSGPGVDDQVISLEQAIKLTVPFKPQQVMAVGHVPAATNVNIYRFLSQQYLEILGRDLPTSEKAEPLDERISRILSQYARAAESVSQFRLAQTWRILAYAMNLLLTSRSKYHLECRLTERKKSPLLKSKDPRSLSLGVDSSSQLRISGEETLRKPEPTASTDNRQTPGRSRLSQEIDSDSNLPTPLARPVQDDVVDYDGPGTAKKLTPVQEMESFSLPPAFHSARYSPRQRLDSTSLSITSQESQKSITDGYDFYDVEAIETLPMAIDVPKKKEPLRLDPMEKRSPNSRRKSALRQDSDESFGQMFSLSDASRQTSLLATSSGGGTQQATNRLGRSGSNEVEFASRIRGRQIEESPVQHKWPIPRPIERQYSDGLTEDFMVSQTTIDTIDTFESDPTDIEVAPPLTRSKLNSPVIHSTMSRFSQSPPRPQDNTSPTITETDFLPWDDDPPYPYLTRSSLHTKRDLSPIKPYEILAQALEFESRRSALNASAMILLLKPLTPDEIIDSYQAAAVLRQHHSRLMNMKLFVEAALLRNLCLRGWPAGIEIWGENYTSIFRPAQDRVAVGFTCAQCHKPREVNRSSADGSEVWKCERCRALVAPCAVCGHREAASDLTPLTVNEGLMETLAHAEDSILSTWWYCPGCSHGGHANCLQDWHAPIVSPQANELLEAPRTELFDDDSPQTNSNGCCPFDGCGHACLPGRWRNESSTSRTEELGRAVREQYRGILTDLKKVDSKQKPGMNTSVVPTPEGSVRGDSLEIPQSRAVESVREALANNGHEKNEKLGGLMGILSSSPGRSGGFMTSGGGGERERRKSVKFAGPADDRR